MKGGWVSDDSDDLAYFSCGVRRFASFCSCRVRRSLFRLAYVPQGERMESMKAGNNLIEQMAVDIADQALQLEESRLSQFLNWLMDHNSSLKGALGEALYLRESELREYLKNIVQTWLEALPPSGMLWEYRLIMDEIFWWHGLEPHRLAMMVGSQ